MELIAKTLVTAPSVNSFKKRLDDHMAEIDTNKAVLHVSIITKYKYIGQWQSVE